MPDYRHRFPCSECGSIRVRCRLTGATEEDQPVRLRRCEDCGHQFTTIEVLSPVSIYRIDVHRRFRNMMRMRELRGYQGGRGPGPRRAPQVIVKVTVVERRAA
jgi:transcription elongation factor Elf1